MLPLRVASNTIGGKKIYRKLVENPLVIDWGWLVTFLIISIFNGWMINESSVETFFLQPELLKKIIAVYFAVFPLAATVYILFKNTKILIISLISSRAILAIALCYLKIPTINSLFLGFLGFNILLFLFILFFVCKTRGFVVPLFILLFTILLALVGLGEWGFHLIWYCNLVVIVNKSGRQLKNFLDSFDAAMLSLSGIAAVGLAIGWVMGGLLT